MLSRLSGAASGSSPIAIMKRAGDSDVKTTQGYIDLAGVTFREEAERLDGRILGAIGTTKRYNGGSVAGCGNRAVCRGLRKLRYTGTSLRTERRRSRTYPAWGCQTSPVLKTRKNWLNEAI